MFDALSMRFTFSVVVPASRFGVVSPRFHKGCGWCCSILGVLRGRQWVIVSRRRRPALWATRGLKSGVDMRSLAARTAAR